jgi:hypothetical protein
VIRWKELVENWGTTPEERQHAYPCDALLHDHDSAYFRGVTVAAPPEVAFRWLCQLRVAPYSYDWIDNGGRRSPRQLTPGLEELAVGQPVMRIFDLADFDPGRHLTLRLRRPGLFPPMFVSYVVIPSPAQRCRLVVKLVLRFRPGLRDRIVQALAPTLDWIMMRRQLLNLARLAERSARGGSAGPAPGDRSQPARRPGSE